MPIVARSHAPFETFEGRTLQELQLGERNFKRSLKLRVKKNSQKRKQGVCLEKAGSAGLDLSYPSIFKMQMDKENRYD